jgi:hypothetical protein
MQRFLLAFLVCLAFETTPSLASDAGFIARCRELLREYPETHFRVLYDTSVTLRERERALVRLFEIAQALPSTPEPMVWMKSQQLAEPFASLRTSFREKRITRYQLELLSIAFEGSVSIENATTLLKRQEAVYGRLDSSQRDQQNLSLGERQSKILYGAVAPHSATWLVGGHSADILNHPAEYRIIDKVVYPNGVVVVRFRKNLAPAGAQPVWSGEKKSSLAPASWTSDDIALATTAIAQPVHLHSTDPKTGDKDYFGRYRGIPWKVVTDQDGNLKASYPNQPDPL